MFVVVVVVVMVVVVVVVVIVVVVVMVVMMMIASLLLARSQVSQRATGLVSTGSRSTVFRSVEGAESSVRQTCSFTFHMQVACDV